MVSGIRLSDGDTCGAERFSPKAFFRPACMKVDLGGNTFYAERNRADGRRGPGSGIAVKNQECEFPCRSDAVIFFMPI